MLERRVGFEAWINSGFKRSTRQNYTIGFRLFLRFMSEITPLEGGVWDDLKLIELRKEDIKNGNFAFEQKVMEFFEWMKTLVQEDREVVVRRKKYRTQPYKLKIKGGKSLSDNTRQSYVHGVRSFFSFHRLDLRFTRQQTRLLSREPKPVMKYYEFTLDDIKRMSHVAKPKEKYVLLVGRAIGLRGGDFIKLRQGSFVAHLDEEAPCSLGEVYTEKEGVYAKPFLDEDAREAASAWLTILKASGRYDVDAQMIDIEEEELTEIIKRLVRKAQINTGGQRVRFHSLRVFLITRLSKVLEENRWKQLVGKKVPEKAYVKPFEIRDDFRKVVPLIAVSERGGDEEVSKLRKVVDGQHEQIELLRGRVEKTDEVFGELEKKLAQLEEKLRKLKEA